MVQQTEETDADLPSNILDDFLEYDEVIGMIGNLPAVYGDKFEKAYEKYGELLSNYQEQPHLLDRHMPALLDALWLVIRAPASPPDLVHAGFKYLYQICKVRTFKVLIKYLPHELSDLDFVLELLEAQDITSSENWETRYMLLLWMSILVLNPFHLSRLDAFTPATEPSNGNSFNHVGRVTKMERIYQVCIGSCQGNDTCSSVAAFLSAKYLIRMDTKELYLPKFFEWVAQAKGGDELYTKHGQLSAVAAVLKYGKREDLIRHVQFLLAWITGLDYKNSTDFLEYKSYIKIIQRIGMVCLPPRIALWRYQRGSRSIMSNLGHANTTAAPKPELQNMLKAEDGPEEDEDPSIEVPEEIEEVIEELLQGLKSASSDIRWLSAKGIGRITNRLPKALGDEVVSSVVEILNPLECHEAWHGACLALAELAKRGLLLPYRLPELVPLLLQALVYDEVKGYVSVGQNIRDAACYMSWAFARAYNPADLQPFVVKIAGGLLITTVFDREINCRRAASAAFQESVGRLGNFPHGIDILTTADFYSVGIRSHSYLEIADFVAQFEEYTRPLIDHLLDRKVNHWDTAIRELTAKTLHKLTKRAPDYMAEHCLPSLLAQTDSIDINQRHGAILAIGEIAAALSELGPAKYLTGELLQLLNGLVLKFQNRDQFRGMSGEMMKKACLSFVANACHGRLAADSACIQSWQWLVDKCVVNKTQAVREQAVAALAALCDTYYRSNECRAANTLILDAYLVGCCHDLEEWVRMGYVSALGALPKFMLAEKFGVVLKALIDASLVPGITRAVDPSENVQTGQWSEARRDSVKALSSIMETVGFEEGEYQCLGQSQQLNREKINFSA
jgi:tubulin-specific chaperone D